VNLARQRTLWSRPGPNGGHCNAAALDDTTAYEAVNAYDPRSGATSTLLAALDRGTGQTRWQVDGPPDPPLPAARWLGFNAATLSQGALFVTNQRSVVSSYDAATGALRWRAYTDLLNNQATVAGGLVYTTTWNGAPNALFAHRVADGSLAWRHVLDDSNTEYPAAAANGRVFVGTDLGALRAINAHTGSALWTVNFAGYLSAPIVATADTVIVNIGLRGLTALDAANGVVRWTSSLPGTVTMSSNLVLANDVLYFVVADLLGTQHVAALDARTGTKLDLSGAAPVGGHYSSISVVGGRVYVSDTSGGLQVYGLVP